MQRSSNRNERQWNIVGIGLCHTHTHTHSQLSVEHTDVTFNCVYVKLKYDPIADRNTNNRMRINGFVNEL